MPAQLFGVVYLERDPNNLLSGLIQTLCLVILEFELFSTLLREVDFRATETRMLGYTS